MGIWWCWDRLSDYNVSLVREGEGEMRNSTEFCVCCCEALLGDWM